MRVFVSFLFVVLTGSVASIERPNDDEISLFQTNTVKLELDTDTDSKPKSKNVEEPGALPGVKTVLKNAERVFTDMSKRVASLEVEMEVARQRGESSLKKSMAQYEEKLESQRKEMRATRSANAKLRLEIEEMQSTNAELKKKAERLSKASNKLKTDMQAVHGHVSMATNYIEKILESSEEELVKAPEVQVLLRLDNITGNNSAASQKKKMGMLQHADPELAHPRDMVHALLDSFDDFVKEHAASEESFKKAFENELHNITVHHKHLLEEQVRLNETMREESELHDQLLVAVKHLKKVHELLLQRSQSLKLFVEHLGGGGQNK